MNRINHDTSFNRNWQDYKTGFGSIENNYWMGLDNMRKILGDQKMKLRIEMFNKISDHSFLIYDRFSIDSERKYYTLDLGFKIDGNTPDTFSSHNLLKFTTYDVDNDSNLFLNCAKSYSAGWWFANCYSMCLTCSGDSGVFDNIKMMIKPNY